MGKIRINVKSNFTQVSNHVLHNTNLSLKAKGLYAYIVSTGLYRISDLTAGLKEGKDAIGKALKELEREEYLVRDFSRQNGKFDEMNYKLNKVPKPCKGV